MGDEDIMNMSLDYMNRILMNSSPCGSARRGNTDVIRMFGGAGRQQAVISIDSHWGGGVTREPTGLSEIEFEVDLGEGTTDYLTILGNEARQVLRYGTLGINMNNDDDADVVFSEAEFLYAVGYGGNDVLSGLPHPSVGDASQNGVQFSGGGGSDVLYGGAAGDVFLDGGPGDDRVSGHLGGDRLWGGLGDDTVLGGSGSDTFIAEATVDGADAIYGGGGGDSAAFYARTVGVSVALDGSRNEEGDVLTGVEVPVARVTMS